MLETYPRGDVLVTHGGGHVISVNQEEADKLKVSNRKQRKGLVYTARYVEENFDNILEVPPGGAPLRIWLQRSSETGGHSLVDVREVAASKKKEQQIMDAGRLLLGVHSIVRKGDGVGQMVGAGDHQWCGRPAAHTSARTGACARLCVCVCVVCANDVCLDRLTYSYSYFVQARWHCAALQGGSRCRS